MEPKLFRCDVNGEDDTMEVSISSVGANIIITTARGSNELILSLNDTKKLRKVLKKIIKIQEGV